MNHTTNDALSNEMHYGYFVTGLKHSISKAKNKDDKLKKEKLAKQPLRSNDNTFVPKILLAEDHKLTQLVIKKHLEMLGCEVEVFDNGKLALDHYAYHSTQYDALILDINMPLMSGDSVCNYIRTIMGHTLPIFAHSTFIELSEEVCKSKGFSACIRKPANIEEIGEILKQYLIHYKTPKIN